MRIDQEIYTWMESGENWNSLLQQLQEPNTVFSNEVIRQQLVQYINHLLLNDFNGLIQLLYRIDVEERKIKNLLKDQPQTDAALLITDLLLTRLEEKAKTRKSFPSKDIPDDEKW